MCDKLGLPKSGKKAELIARLLEEGQDGGEPSGAKEEETEETDSSDLESLSYKDLQVRCPPCRGSDGLPPLIHQHGMLLSPFRPLPRHLTYTHTYIHNCKLRPCARRWASPRT